MPINLNDYSSGNAHDELLTNTNRARPGAGKILNYLRSLTDAELRERREAAELAMQVMGITFTVYSEEGGGIDRVWPFDIIPRILTAREWYRIDEGLKQRVQALNMFIADIYDEQKIIRDKIFPKEVLAQSVNFREQCIGIKPAYDIWAHICGSDLVRGADGTMYVLEDNLRVPSGVSYMLENRLVMKRVFPELFEDNDILPVDGYSTRLFDMLAALSPRPAEFPSIVVLTPGIYNSAYFEHSYLAQQMGVELVAGSDLVVEDDIVYMKTISGRARVDVIYRRVDDLFMDPEVFDKESMLGVPGIMRAWRKGNVAIANAPGAGVADDKVVYAYVPEMIRYYLDQQPILPNVPTYLCMDKTQRDYVLDNLENMVVKPANESGGYGMMVGPAASLKVRREFLALIKKNPRNYIAQPTLNLSTVPTLCDGVIEPRHVDLRPFILSSDASHVTRGGLTRVALNKGSLVVNSSQGGGSKDTWIIETRSN
ncbi:MAG: circularly permuted type 2 ATP-grasp protein [Gammaproteobacteria bacterium]|nr:circularly permuted type 2 ATP-grasp protein [Gammaproteobacteria bacterium]